jgi:hypothetical protein
MSNGWTPNALTPTPHDAAGGSDELPAALPDWEFEATLHFQPRERSEFKVSYRWGLS